MPTRKPPLWRFTYSDNMTDTKHKFPILKEKSSEVEIQNFEVEIF